MAARDLWASIHAEREAHIADFEGLSDEQWAAPSLCTGWPVRQVAGHLIAAAGQTPLKFFGGLIGTGFRFNVLTGKQSERDSTGTGADIVARYKACAGGTNSPPGPTPTWLGEAVVHGEDYRRPLGLTRAYPESALTTVADFYKGSNLLIGGKKRVAGLRMRATDADWVSGDGPLVEGPMASIVCVIAGRSAALSDLSGEGVEQLRTRTP